MANIKATSFNFNDSNRTDEETELLNSTAEAFGYDEDFDELDKYDKEFIVNRIKTFAGEDNYLDAGEAIGLQRGEETVEQQSSGIYGSVFPPSSQT